MTCPRRKQRVDTRRRLNPLFNDNKLKLGLFGVNVSNGCAITTAEDRHTVSWPTNLAIAQTADKYGYEAMVPVARWRGFGGESNFNGTNFETYTWAAGLGQANQKHLCFDDVARSNNPSHCGRKTGHNGRPHYQWAFCSQHRLRLVYARARDVRRAANGTRYALRPRG